MGLLLGINGCFTYKKNEYIREAVKKARAGQNHFGNGLPVFIPARQARANATTRSNIPLIGTFVADYLNMPGGNPRTNHRSKYKRFVRSSVNLL